MRLWLCRLLCPKGYVVHPRRGPQLYTANTANNSTVTTTTWTYWGECC